MNAGYPQPIRVTAKCGEPLYNSFHEAIHGSKSEPRAIRAEQDSGEVRGSTVQSFRFTDDSLTLWLSNGKSLCFFVDDRGVEWKIADARSFTVVDDEQPPESLVLRFEGLDRVYTWSRCRLLNAMIGKQIVRLSAGREWVFLDVRSCETLLLMRIVDCDSNAGLLFYDPE